MEDKFDAVCSEIRIQGLTYKQECVELKKKIVLDPVLRKQTQKKKCTKHRVVCTEEQCGRF